MAHGSDENGRRLAAALGDPASRKVVAGSGADHFVVDVVDHLWCVEAVARAALALGQAVLSRFDRPEGVRPIHDAVARWIAQPTREQLREVMRARSAGPKLEIEPCGVVEPGTVRPEDVTRSVLCPGECVLYRSNLKQMRFVFSMALQSALRVLPPEEVEAALREALVPWALGEARPDG